MELFKRLPKDELGLPKLCMDLQFTEHIKNLEFQKLLLQLGEPEPFATYCFVGGEYDSIFRLDVVLQSNQTSCFHVYYSKDCDENHIKVDFPLLKQFLGHKLKKVSHE